MDLFIEFGLCFSSIFSNLKSNFPVAYQKLNKNPQKVIKSPLDKNMFIFIIKCIRKPNKVYLLRFMFPLRKLVFPIKQCAKILIK